HSRGARPGTQPPLPEDEDSGHCRERVRKNWVIGKFSNWVIELGKFPAFAPLASFAVKIFLFLPSPRWRTPVTVAHKNIASFCRWCVPDNGEVSNDRFCAFQPCLF